MHYRTQKVLLDSMKLGSNIARNAALRENVFMMVICIELRIPLFLVGKPGSSKSLAKSIVTDSMLGNTSESNLLKNFKEVMIHVCTRKQSYILQLSVCRSKCSRISAVSYPHQRV